MPTARRVFTVLAPLPHLPVLEDSHPDTNNNRPPSVEVIRHTQQQYVSIAGDEDTADFPLKIVLYKGSSVMRSAEGYVIEHGGYLRILENVNKRNFTRRCRLVAEELDIVVEKLICRE